MRGVKNSHRMHDLCEITSSKRIYASDYKLDGVPFYRGKEISEKHRGNLDVSTELFIDREKFVQIRSKFGAPQAGDLLLTSVGTLGSPYVVREREEFYFKDGNLIWFRNFNKLDSKYLYYWLLSPQGRNELKKCTIGSSQPAYTIVLLKEIEIDLPSLPNQRKIAAILSAYDDLIENNLHRIQILEEIAQNLYREWFVHFRFPGFEKAQFVDTPKGKIPEGWELVHISDVAKVFRGRSYRSHNLVEEGGYPFINLKCINRDGGFRYDGIKRYQGPFTEKQSVKPGDLVIAMTDMTQERRIVARAARIPDFGEDLAVISMDLVKVKANDAISSSYLYGMLRFSSFPDQVKQYANGANVLHLNPDRISEFELLLPPEDLRNYFGEFVDALYRNCDILTKKNLNLSITRDFLLPKLISGKLEIKDKEIG